MLRYDEHTSAAPALSSLPYPHNPFFTGRAKALNDIRAALEQDRIVAVNEAPSLQGARGIGKTQTAVAYSYRFRDDYAKILWLRADSEWTLLEDFLGLAGDLGLTQQPGPSWSAAIAYVIDWLNHHPGWLITIDNVAKFEALRPWLPDIAHGHVVLISRGQAFSSADIRRSVELTELLEEEAVRFLYKRTGRLGSDSVERKAASTVAARLGCIPLALELAAGLIAAKELEFRDYVHRLDETQSRLTQKGTPGPSREPYREAAALALRLAFEELEPEAPLSAEFFRWNAFQGSEVIPLEHLLGETDTYGPQLAPTMSRARDNARVLDDLVEPLARYGLIRLNLDSRSYSVHPHLQELVRISFGKTGRQTRAQQFVQAADGAFRAIDTGDPERGQVSFESLRLAHAATQLIQQGNGMSAEAVHLSSLLASVMNARVGFRAAESLFRSALGVSEGMHGPTHADVISGWHDLGCRYAEDSRQSQADQCFKRSLVARERALGREHPEVAAYLHDLGRRYDDRGWHIQADQFFTRSLGLREKAMGKGHLEVAHYLHILGRRFADLRRDPEADQCFDRSLAIREKNLGEDHIDVAAYLHELASHYADHSRFEDAAPLFERALALARAALPAEDPALAQYLHSMALFHQTQRRFKPAERLYQEALAIRERSHDPKLPVTLNNFAALYHEQGKYAKAEPLLKRMLALARRSLAPDHPDLAVCLNNMGALFLARRKYIEAQPLLERALAIRQEHHQSDHPALLTTLENYAVLLRKLKRLKDALDIESRALAIREKQEQPQATAASNPPHTA